MISSWCSLDRDFTAASGWWVWIPINSSLIKPSIQILLTTGRFSSSNPKWPSELALFHSNQPLNEAPDCLENHACHGACLCQIGAPQESPTEQPLSACITQPHLSYLTRHSTATCPELPDWLLFPTQIPQGSFEICLIEGSGGRNGALMKDMHQKIISYYPAHCGCG